MLLWPVWVDLVNQWLTKKYKVKIYSAKKKKKSQTEEVVWATDYLADYMISVIVHKKSWMNIYLYIYIFLLKSICLSNWSNNIVSIYYQQHNGI